MTKIRDLRIWLILRLFYKGRNKPTPLKGG